MSTVTAILRAAGLAGAAVLTVACGGSAPGPAAPGQALYQRSLTYSRCMRSHGVPDFPSSSRDPGARWFTR